MRLKPKLYDDLLRRAISEHSNQAEAWESQSIISREERDALEIIHRRLLADEDHWIIDARRITPLQAILSAATWLTVVATVLTVWMLRDELAPPWRWLLPAFFATALLLAGNVARRGRENLAAATFLAGAALAIAPATLALLAELRWFATPPAAVTQLFPDTFTNQQVLAASLTALAVSVFGLWRLKMTGFAWTTATLATTSYLSLLLLFNWLEQKPEIQALWCLPLALMEFVALALERAGRVRWTMPFHLIAVGALVIGLDVVAFNGPTLKMLGVTPERWSYFDHERQVAFSVVLNGLLFLALMLVGERSASLDLRRASKWLEVLAIVHTISALFANAMNHEGKPLVRVDVWLYLAAALFFAVLAPVSLALADARGRAGGLRTGQLPARGSGPGGAQTVHHRTGPARFGGGPGRVHLRETRNAGGRAVWQRGEETGPGLNLRPGLNGTPRAESAASAPALSGPRRSRSPAGVARDCHLSRAARSA